MQIFHFQDCINKKGLLAQRRGPDLCSVEILQVTLKGYNVGVPTSPHIEFTVIFQHYFQNQ